MTDADAPPPSLPPDSLPPGSLPPESIPPPSAIERPGFVPPRRHVNTLLEDYEERLLAFVQHLGEISTLTVDTAKALGKRPLEVESTVRQMEALGIRSMGIVVVSSLFIGVLLGLSCWRFAVKDY